ncbi:MAG: hypothetical protein Q7T97_15925 [Burkholderiaceae bacterium]|nr:hypothetical protein [Burkholderiaceae bacterium]
MNFRVDRWSAAALRSSLLAVTMAGTLLLASCGGGNGNENQSVKFSAERLIVFGDESSLLLPPSTPTAIDARKYSINGFTANTTPANSVPDCLVNPIWVQYVAFKYGLVFAECNPNGSLVTAQMRAANGAKVADVVAALDAFFASGATLGKRDLITLMVGTHDILELYGSVSTASVTEAAAMAEAKRRGELLADQIDRLTNKNNTAGRAIYVPVPDLSETPFGFGAEAGRTERVRLLKAISESFNNALRAEVTNNGRSIGLLNAFQRFRNIVRAVDDGDEPFGFVNATEAACTVALPDCTTLTMQPANGSIAAADEFTWLWADGTRLSAGAHQVLGEDATDLLDTLPF